MARPVMCDTGHEPDLPYAYMVTDGTTGDVVALCLACMVDFAAAILREAEWTTEPPAWAVAEPGPEAKRKANEYALAHPEMFPAELYPDGVPYPDEPVGVVPTDLATGDVDAAESNQAAADAANDALRQEQRVADELAARPDAATTSEVAVPWPSEAGNSDH